MIGEAASTGRISTVLHGHVVLRADASAEIGTGHVVRCRTLGEALLSRGWTATLVSRRLDRRLGRSVDVAGIERLELPLSLPIDAEPRYLARTLRRPVDLLVADHYAIGAHWLTAARDWAATLLSIDDLADRAQPVDLLLNQNFGVAARQYIGLCASVRTGARRSKVRARAAGVRGRASAAARAIRPSGARAGVDGRQRRTRRDPARRGGRGRCRDIGRRRGRAAVSAPCGVAVVGRRPGARSVACRSARAGRVDGGRRPGDRRAGIGELGTLRRRAADGARDPRSEPGRSRRRLVDVGAARSLGWQTDVTSADVTRMVRSLAEDPTTVRAMSEVAASVTDGRGTARMVGVIERTVSATVRRADGT